MSDNYQFKLKNNKSGKEIKFYHGSGMTDTISINSINFSVPGQSVENNITMNLGGFSKLVSFQFILQSDGTTDVSTTSDNIVTLPQQWGFIMDNTVTNNIGGSVTGIVQNPGSGNSVAEITYTITVYYKIGDTGGTKTYTGMIEEIAIEPVEGEPRLRGRLTLNVAGFNPFA